MDSLNCNMLKGVAKLVVAYGDTLNDEQFVARLSKVSVREIIRTAKDRHAGTQGYAEAMLLHYNKRLKYPLRWNDLRSAPEQPAASSTDCSADDLQVSMERGFLLDTAPSYERPEIMVTEFDDYEDEEIPDHEDALQKQMLMDNLNLRNADWSWGRI